MSLNPSAAPFLPHQPSIKSNLNPEAASFIPSGQSPPIASSYPHPQHTPHHTVQQLYDFQSQPVVYQTFPQYNYSQYPFVTQPRYQNPQHHSNYPRQFSPNTNYVNNHQLNRGSNKKTYQFELPKQTKIEITPKEQHDTIQLSNDSQTSEEVNDIVEEPQTKDDALNEAPQVFENIEIKNNSIEEKSDLPPPNVPEVSSQVASEVISENIPEMIPEALTNNEKNDDIDKPAQTTKTQVGQKYNIQEFMDIFLVSKIKQINISVPAISNRAQTRHNFSNRGVTKQLERNEATRWKSSVMDKNRSQNEEKSEQAIFEKTITELKLVLNKLTAENLESLAPTFVELSARSNALTRASMDLIIDVAQTQHKFSQIYSEICLRWQSKVENSIQIEFKKKMQQEISFPIDEKLKEVEEEGAKSGLDSDTIYENVTKIKTRFLGHIKFFGELFNMNSISFDKVEEAFNTLMTNPTDNKIEAVCTLLSTVGGKVFKTINKKDKQAKKSGNGANQKKLKKFFLQLEPIQKDTAFSIRTRFGILDLMDMKKKQWLIDDEPKQKDENEAFIEKKGKGSKSDKQKKDKKASKNNNIFSVLDYDNEEEDETKEKAPMQPSIQLQEKPIVPVSIIQPESNVSSEDADIIERKARNIYHEFFINDDFDEVCASLQEMADKKLLSSRIFEFGLMEAFESPRYVDRIIQLFIDLYATNQYSSDKFQLGFWPVIDFLDEIIIDFPIAKEVSIKIIGSCIIHQIVNFSFLQNFEELKFAGKALDFVTDLLVFIQGVKSQNYVLDIFRNALFDFNKLLGSSQANLNLQEYLASKGLSYLKL